MSNEPRAQAGINAYDVRGALRDCERHYNCRLHFRVTLPLRKDARHALDFQLCAVSASVGADGAAWSSGVSRTWPTGECRTLTGLMFRLVHDLEIKLEEKENEAKRLRQGSLFDKP